MTLRLGTVYLLHFDRPFHHARHYIGWTRDVGRRLVRHRTGTGSPLVMAATNAGIPFTVARVWHNVTVRFERRLHNMHHKLLCPKCMGRNAMRPARPRISDYREPPSDPRPTTFDVCPNPEPPPDLEESLPDPWEEHPSFAEVLLELDAELSG